ncbi:MAG: response regulator [Chloroflexaceae bacterium]|nr:response regulator [Chloroflexaceae bacterium]
MTTPATILIVDDEEPGRQTLEALLMAYGYRLLFSANGPEALETAAREVPDLILLDVMMPGMDGFEVCERLRHDPLLAEVPVIMVTALDDRESRLRGLDVGADDFLSKPIDRMELCARIKTIVRLNRYRQLLSERSRFEWIAKQSSDGLIIIDAHDIIRYCNPQARHYLNLDLESDALPTEPFFQLVKHWYVEQPESAWVDWPHIDDNPMIPTERYLVQPESMNAPSIWFQVDVLTLPIEHETGHLIRLRDITVEMARSRSLWTFHSLILHKLRTPITGLVGGLQILVDDAADLSGQDIGEFAQIALVSARRLHDQLEAILRYVRQKDLALSDERCAVQHIPMLLEQIQTQMELAPITIDPDRDVLPADRALVLPEQIISLMFHEILSNAQKFHPKRTPHITVTIDTNDESWVRLHIQDDGTTLSAEQLAHVWLPYYQAEKYFIGEVPGMGLGLAMVASLLWNVGGRYHMTNRTHGPGVVVELAIPCVLPESG